MAVILDTVRGRCVIDGQEWSCEDPEVETHLNRFLDQFRSFSQDPDPDLTVAQNVQREFGGKITVPKTHKPLSRNGPPGAVY